MISSMLEPATRFSKTVATGIRVLRNTHAPLNFPGTLSTAGHWDQSRAAMLRPPYLFTFYHGLTAGSRGEFRPYKERQRTAKIINPAHLPEIFLSSVINFRSARLILVW